MSVGLSKSPSYGNFEKQDILIYGEKNGSFQKNKYEVSTREFNGSIEIKIHNRGKNSIIKNVPKGQEQAVLDEFYGKNKDTFFKKDVYNYSPKKVSYAPESAVIAVTQETQEEIVPLKFETVKNKISDLKVSQPYIYREFKNSGILLNDIENKEQLSKLENTLDYLNYIYTVTRASDLDSSTTSQEISDQNKQEIVKKYKELISPKTDYILNKDFLAYKYLEAIVGDVKNMGYIIQKLENGDYIVVCDSDLKENKSPDALRAASTVNKKAIGDYSDILTMKSLHSNDLDIAIMSNILVRDDASFDKILSQKQFINKLFTKHDVLTNIRDEDKTKYLIQKKDEIVNQIEKRLKKIGSMQDYQELSYLLDFVKNFTLGKDEDTFKKANTYAKGFLAEKAFYDAYRAGEIEGVDPTKTTEEQIAGFIRNNRGTSIVLGLVSWLMGYKKTALGAIGLGLFGGSAAEILEGVGGAARNAVNPMNDRINPIREDQMIGLLEENEDYSEKYKELAKINSELSGGGFKKDGDLMLDMSGKNLPSKTLFSIVDTITKESIDIKLSDDSVASTLKSKLVEAGMKSVSDKEVELFLDLINDQGIKDEKDEYLLDALTKGDQDILNKPFDGGLPTGEAVFSGKINEKLKEFYDKEFANKKDERKNRKKIVEIQKIISDGLSTSSGLWENVKDFKFSMPDLSIQIANINSEIKNLDEDLSTTIETVLTEYKSYSTLKAELAGFEGIWDENKDTLNELWTNAFEIGGKVSSWVAGKAMIQKTQLANSISTKITKLDGLKTKLEPYKDKDGFKELFATTDKIIANLKVQKDRLNKEIRESGGKTNDEFTPLTEVGYLKAYKENPMDLNNISRSNYDYIHDFYEDLDDLKLDDIKSRLEDISIPMKVLDDYIKHNNATLVTRTAIINTETVDTNKNHRLALQDTLDSFIVEKGVIESKVKEVLNEFYSVNKTQKESLGSITKASLFEDDLKVLDAVSVHLAEKGVVLGDSKIKALNDLEKANENLRKAVDKMKIQASVQNTSGKKKVDLSIYDKALSFFDDSKNTIKGAWNNSTDKLSNLDNKVIEYYHDAMSALSGVNKGSMKTEMDKLTEAIGNAGDIFKDDNYDNQAEEALKEARIVFGTTFMSGAGTVTLEDLKKEYDEKKKSTEVKMEDKVNNISFDVSKLDNTKKDLEKLRKYSERYPNSSVILNKRDELIGGYIKNKEILMDQDFMSLVKDIKNSIDPNKHPEMSSLFDMERSDKNNMTLEGFILKWNSLMIEDNQKKFAPSLYEYLENLEK